MNRIVPFVVAVCAALSLPALSADKWNKLCLPVGTQAPDFTLPRLMVTTDPDGKSTGSITEETVTLSSLRNRQIAVLFFSSYT